MLARRSVLSGAAGAAALLSGCAYRPPGYADPSLVHVPWLVDHEKLLFVLEGGDGNPALPARLAIWDFATRSGASIAPLTVIAGTMPPPRRTATGL
jgi:hypothetical protein